MPLGATGDVAGADRSVEALTGDLGSRVENWRAGLEARAREWSVARDATGAARRQGSKAVRRAALALRRVVERETGLSLAGFAGQESALALGRHPGSPAARRHREAVRRAHTEVRALREALDEVRQEAARSVKAADVCLAEATRELLAYCARADEVAGLALEELGRLSRRAWGPSSVSVSMKTKALSSGDRSSPERCRPEGGWRRRSGGTMTQTGTKARAQALAREAMQAGASYEKAVGNRSAAVARRSEVLARLDQAVADAEAAVVEAMASAVNLLGPVAAAMVLGLGEC